MSRDAYRRLFVEFARAELSSGGPDPQVRLIGETVKCEHADLLPWQQAALCGLFVTPYTVGGAAVLWHLYRAGLPTSEWAPILIHHKDGFPMRRERRAVWGDDRRKLIACVDSWIEFCYRTLPSMSSSMTYDDLYTAISKQAKYFGRYATMKVIETMANAGLSVPRQTSIVARDAKYPRKMLALMFPEEADRLNSKANDAETVAVANALASEAAGWIDMPVTWFDIETLLCNARQAHDGKYPGRSHDRELAHWRRANGHFIQHGVDLRALIPFYAARRALFPIEYLGETGNPQWWGARDELEAEQKRRVADALAAG